MDDTELYAELVHRMNLDGSLAEPRPDRTGIEIRRWASVDLDSPVILEIDPASLSARVRTIAADAIEVFPTAEPWTAALQLLLVHVHEALDTRHPDTRKLVLAPDGISSN